MQVCYTKQSILPPGHTRHRPVIKPVVDDSDPRRRGGGCGLQATLVPSPRCRGGSRGLRVARHLVDDGCVAAPPLQPVPFVAPSQCLRLHLEARGPSPCGAQPGRSRILPCGAARSAVPTGIRPLRRSQPLPRGGARPVPVAALAVDPTASSAAGSAHLHRHSPGHLSLPLHQSQSNPASPHRLSPNRSPSLRSMATLTMQQIAPSPAPAAQEDQRKRENPAADAADLSDINSGWVLLKNSDVVSADLAAAAISGSQGSSTIPSWARWVLGCVVYTVVPFYNRVRQLEEETVGFVENAVEVVEHIAEATEKLAANVAKQLPEDGSLQKAVEEVEHIAEVVDADAEKVEAVTEKIDKVSDEIDAAVEPVIEELEKDIDQGTTSNNGATTQK